MVRRRAHRGLRQENLSTTENFHNKDRCRFHARVDLSNSSIFLHLIAAKGPLGKTQYRRKRKDQEASCEEENA